MFDVFFVGDAIKRNMPDGDVKALSMGSGFSLDTKERVWMPASGLRQRYDLHISSGKQDPGLVDMSEEEGFRDAVVPECGLQDFCQRVLRGPNQDPEVLHIARMG